ncbi:MAG TPA: hypothetical protein VL017_09840 [Devosia sp.]|nr:hypothetical protein [Sphingomonadaceae bacterium]HTO28878.1 hypothetical protein [Devosia sp.]
MAKAPGSRSPASALAGLAMRQGAKIARRSLDNKLRIGGYSPSELEGIVSGKGFVGTMAVAAVTRLATRSVPGALVVGGGLVAKALYDRRQRVRAAEQQATSEQPGTEKSEEKRG